MSKLTPGFEVGKKDPSVVYLKNVRLSHPFLFEPSAFQDGQKKTYSLHVLVPKDSQAAKDMLKHIEGAAKAKWGAKSASYLAAALPDKMKCFWRDGNTKGAEEYEGHMFAALSNDIRPRVVDVDNTVLTEESGRPYSGCYVNVSFQVWLQDNKFGRGIRNRLRGVQFVADGAPFGAGRQTAADDEFEEIQPAEGASLESLIG